jgi:hypothetical protein
MDRGETVIDVDLTDKELIIISILLADAIRSGPVITDDYITPEFSAWEKLQPLVNKALGRT